MANMVIGLIGVNEKLTSLGDVVRVGPNEVCQRMPLSVLM